MRFFLYILNTVLVTWWDGKWYLSLLCCCAGSSKLGRLCQVRGLRGRGAGVGGGNGGGSRRGRRGIASGSDTQRRWAFHLDRNCNTSPNKNTHPTISRVNAIVSSVCHITRIINNKINLLLSLNKLLNQMHNTKLGRAF